MDDDAKFASASEDWERRAKAEPAFRARGNPDPTKSGSVGAEYFLRTSEGHDIAVYIIRSGYVELLRPPPPNVRTVSAFDAGTPPPPTKKKKYRDDE